jgi:GNAT superfamily N-acetyltransferase
MTLRIRLATKEDIPALVESRLAFMEALLNKPISDEVRENGNARLPAQFEQLLADNLFCFLAENEGEIVSVAYFYILHYLFHPKLPTGHFGRLSNVYTPPEHRKQRYARAVLEHIIQFAKERNLDSITLEASDVAKPLYEELGFKADNLDQHMPMTLKLA